MPDDSARTLKALADRLEAIASRGGTAKLLPESALICARIIKRSLTGPRREDIVREICATKRCELRNSCMTCIGKANAVMALYEGV